MFNASCMMTVAGSRGAASATSLQTLRRIHAPASGAHNPTAATHRLRFALAAAYHPARSLT